jgi:hypothetical protein
MSLSVILLLQVAVVEVMTKAAEAAAVNCLKVLQVAL